MTFDLFCWPAPITNSSVYITDRPATAAHHAKTGRFIVCLSTQGETEGVRLSALLGEAAAQGAAGAPYTSTHVWKLRASVCFVPLKHRH